VLRSVLAMIPVCLSRVELDAEAVILVFRSFVVNGVVIFVEGRTGTHPRIAP
jgi:hypothetical protein